MALLTMRQDFRVPADGSATSREIYDAAMDQFVWADEHGFNALVLSEHHGVADGWMPAPLTMAAAVLARTTNARVMISACVLPLHDPIRVAEQIAVLDNAFPGRLWVTFGAGYRVEEFEMAGLEHAARGKVLEDHVATVLEALENDVFEWRGTDVRVTPRMITNPRTMLFVGGGVPAAARRAARLRLPMFPMNAKPEVPAAYYDEAKKIGFEGGFVITPGGPTYVLAADDPDKAWAEVGPYVMHEVQTYVSFQTEGQTSLPAVHASTLAELRNSPQYLVGTPDEVAAGINALPPTAGVVLNPLAGGTPPSIAWPLLAGFADKVLPQLTPASR
jgi:alkanesulfonate monooxygenase SsuD/methylene tetrahydromethanopterin reductase-like flavin-dependent oxidoreductase (luciferase family)